MEVEEDVEQQDEKVDVAQDEKNVTSSDAPGSPEIEDKLEEELPVPPVEASEDEKTDASEKEDAEGTPDSESESETETGSAVKIDWALAPSYVDNAAFFTVTGFVTIAFEKTSHYNKYYKEMSR